jgi:uncharacterized membrane protein (DUF2068 family)
VADAPPQLPLHRRRTRVLVAIGVFRLIKAVALVVVGMAAAHVIADRSAAADLARHLLERCKLDPEGRLAQTLLARLFDVREGTLRAISAASFVYATVYAVEGAGLIGGWHWAEWLVVVTTSLLLPFEGYEMVHRASWVKACAILINLLVVLYLVHRLRRDRREVRTARAQDGERVA